jgi:hypothetical protein
MLFSEKISIYSVNHMKHMGALCEQNAEAVIVKARGICT